ncbi:MAG: 2-succinyl-5-enolpyruvyl-6-hydroxy-3-cyclohexene-1-carboxylic-acid synthase [Prevotella sp.]
MFPQVEILIGLMRCHDIRSAVLCPGSRNAPIIHAITQTDIHCFPVTDERSAGFFALGIAEAERRPVAVCVTSGSALLNLAPAVAEAFYRHLPLVVISADRPAEWIGQLDGQTLPQAGALGGFAAKCVSLPDITDEDKVWHCSRLINEALTASLRGCPVHINVPLHEPLFDFRTSDAPEVRAIRLFRPDGYARNAALRIAGRIANTARPMIVIGQMADNKTTAAAIERLSKRFVVIKEPLSPGLGAVPFDEVVYAVGNNADYKPDFILYAGDTIVSKRMKRFLRDNADAETWAISSDGEIHDTLMNQTAVFEMSADDVLACLDDCVADGSLDTDADNAPQDNKEKAEARSRFYGTWNSALAEVRRHQAAFEPPYSQMMAVKLFEQMTEELDYDFHTHYANSSAVRLGNIFSNHYIHVNRGVNGIEGSLSTAAGFSAAVEEMTFCVTGDLSFFYDSNALWNRNLKGNLRILLLNNCGGGIFHTLPGLEATPSRDVFVAASHQTSAHGICDSHDIGYISARNADELRQRMSTFLFSGTHRPLVFEVFTSPDDDKKALTLYLDGLKENSNLF